MARFALTDRAAAAAKAGPEGRLELWDERISGLCLRVTGRGVKTWVFRYRADDGRQPRFTLGRFPAVGVRDARDAAHDIMRNVRSGADPAAERRKSREAASSPATFGDLADLYLRECAAGYWRPKNKTKRARTLADETGILRRHILPAIGSMPYTSITRAHVKDLLRGMREKGIGAQTNRAHAVIRQVFAFAISEELVEINPATGFARFAEERPRMRIWEDKELAALWPALTDCSGLRTAGGPVQVSEPVRIALKLTALLGQRRGEVAGMEVAELNLEARTWLIRPARMKGNRPHMVPLSAPAVALIRRAMELANFDRDQPSAYVFPTTLLEDQPITANAVTRALRRITDALGLEGLTVHDLRRTVSTNLTSERLGVSPFIRSKVLGHLDAGGGAMVSSTHYDANTYLAEKRRALEAWAELLMSVVGEATPVQEEPARERPSPRLQGGDARCGRRAGAVAKRGRAIAAARRRGAI